MWSVRPSRRCERIFSSCLRNVLIIVIIMPFALFVHIWSTSLFSVLQPDDLQCSLQPGLPQRKRPCPTFNWCGSIRNHILSNSIDFLSFLFPWIVTWAYSYLHVLYSVLDDIVETTVDTAAFEYGPFLLTSSIKASPVVASLYCLRVIYWFFTCVH